MKKILSKTAVTLLELIITSVIVVIVVLGIFAINSLLSNNNQDYGQKYSVKSATQVTLNHILNNASSAIGSAINTTLSDGSLAVDNGILLGGSCTAPNTGGDLGCSDPANNPNSFCIHQDIKSGPYPAGINIDNAPANNTPDDYSDDRWLCYTWYPANNPTCPAQMPSGIVNCSNDIFYCVMPYNAYVPTQPGPQYRGAASCNSASVISANGDGPFYLGTAYSISIPIPPNTSSPSFVTNGTSPGVFTITIENCLDNSASSCNTGATPGTSSDPANNPESQLTGSSFTLQEGMQQP